MRHSFAALSLAGLVTGSLAVSACGADAPAPAPVPTQSSAPATAPTSAPGPTSAPAPASSPTGPAAPTDPTKLDAALLQPAQLPGWERVESEQPPLGSVVEPAECQAIYDQTLGKSASDMGATAAFQRGDQFLQEYVDLVDRGSDAVSMVEQAVTACPRFTTVDEGERTSVTVSALAVPSLEERSYGVRLAIGGAAPAELLYVWAGYRDVVLMLHLDGPQADEATLSQTAQLATDQLRTALGG